MTRVEFVIDELVLIGFDPHDRHRIADGVERALQADTHRGGMWDSTTVDARASASERVGMDAVADAVAGSVVAAARGALAAEMDDRRAIGERR